MTSAWPLLYAGSVKNLLGPVQAGGGAGVVFEYTDAYSVFDWGRMPDALESKGRALATLAATWFERLEKPESWKEFLGSSEARALLADNRFGPGFAQWGDRLAREGLRTHYLGVLADGAKVADPAPLAMQAAPPRFFVAREVTAVRPLGAQVLGRALCDYGPTRISQAPRLVPLEVVFRFSAPAGSSLLERVQRNPDYLSEIGFSGWKVGANWEFPVLEVFTKLESTDRILTLSEALAISGISAAQLESLLFKTAWLAGIVRYWCARAGLTLADGKFEWGVDAAGEIFLVDAIGPDELRILKDGIQLSKEFLRSYYRGSSWYDSLSAAKARAKDEGTSDWKRFVPAPPSALDPLRRELAVGVYQALTNVLTGKAWFPAAPALDAVVAGIAALESKR